MRVFILLFIPTIVECLRLQLFKSPDYQGFIGEYKLSLEEEQTCISTDSQFPAGLRVGSIKTDKCVILYETYYCNSRDAWYNQRLEKDTPTVKDGDGSNTLNIRGFHVCSQKLGGGPLLDVDFYSDIVLRGYVLVKHRNVCSCQNIPSNITTKQLHIKSIDNHGNGLAIFEKENCQPPYAYLPPGRNQFSNDLFFPPPHIGHHDFITRSFYPMGSVSCVRLEASVVKFVTKNDPSPDNVEFENVTSTLESVFRNNGTAKITQVYTSVQRVKDVFEFTRAKGFSNVHTVGVDVGIENKLSFGIPFVAEEKATLKITGKYQWQGTTSGTDTEKRSVENEETITISQSIEIPPCSEYHVNSFVKMVKNYTIEYTAISRLTGKTGEGDEPMGKNELKLHVEPGMEFIRDIDENTIEVSVQGEMFAKYGVQTLIVGEGHLIPGCLKNTNLYSNVIEPVLSFVIEQPIKRE